MVGFSQGTALSRPPVEAAVNNMSAAGSESTDGDPGLNDIGAFTERFYTVVVGRDPLTRYGPPKTSTDQL